ncbi:3-oxoacyl-[acyl-carrier-protein] reductase [Pedobacter cryoconitis]|uniref:3-oxoacyl-[acyl-carrier-protein] reductase n=1 Tax=Pedobacter cryoconitis TaxID=188932 RepID=A0A127V9U1_9SPHI|nr:SDR family oxidoreductase [Pedobacter cryoconitis]AMP97941.1 3-oxoacyl-[acyl-carrier-protein] reductase [Pedobacter cryoconitis]
MDLHLDSKTAFISGSTQGIGFAIAKQLVKEGVSIILNGRNQQKLDLAIQSLQKEYPDSNISGIVADFSNGDEVKVLIAALPPVDILINNVGIFELKSFGTITDAEWTRFFEVNVMSGVRLSRALLPKMLDKNWGRVIFISSESGINIPENMIHYGMTKTALLSISNGLAKLTKGSQVTVNTILGGPTYSDGVAEAIVQIAHAQNQDPEQLKAYISTSTNPTSLLQRFIEPEEIASLAVYLSSPLSIATNGASLRADGGVLTGI